MNTMNETRIPRSREVMEHEDHCEHAEWRRNTRNNITVFLLSIAGWGTAAGLWWLGGKL